MVYRKDIKATVVDGPTKMDLVTALAYAYDRQRRPFSVTFYVQSKDLKVAVNLPGAKGTPVKGTPVEAIITGISHENGTGESFNIEGYLDPYGRPTPEFDTEFKGYYLAKSRTGTLEFYIHTADGK